MIQISESPLTGTVISRTGTTLTELFSILQIQTEAIQIQAEMMLTMAQSAASATTAAMQRRTLFQKTAQVKTDSGLILLMLQH